ncbi:hypothetical protein AQUCO_02000370v1 [Aquilegia coerulea]|uniref:Neprosin PEP catalytic domain-containing protein n=1 Tax=Aquilegia coerulea TaxID=218851 RepID=A0A2G5DH89_AQUCA|nr:hypothetical protein AQUCO_02000370v1 [Aquilegia coerulea]
MGKVVYFHGFVLEALMLLLAVHFVLSSDGLDNMSMSKHNLSTISKKLKLLNPPAVKSFKSADGDTINCVELYKQPAFNHPALRNHTIQMKPSPGSTGPTIQKQNSPRLKVVSQVWKRSGSCPKGTVPIRKIKKADLLRAGSLDRFGRKNPTVADESRRNKNIYADQTNGSNPIRRVNDIYFTQANHSTAVLVTEGFSYSGAKADINVWMPSVEWDDEYTTGQIWLRNGPWYNFESMEAGWMINPSVYGDRQPRLFVYWTADSSKETGCFDLLCSGFVQTSEKIALGSVMDPVSWPGPYQYQITLYIYKDFDTNNWWLQYGNDVNIGYWPAELFSSLCHQATFVEWGGQVYSSRIGKAPHTATGMGSGQTLRTFGYGCYIRQIRIRDNNLILKYPVWVDTYTDEYNCYHAFNNWEYMIDPEFYFGGPGRSPVCP